MNITTIGDDEVDPFDLGAELVIDTTPEVNVTRGCNTDDGCTPTCVSSCASAV